MEWTCWYLKFSVPDGDRFKQFQNKFEAWAKWKHKCTQDASCSFDGLTMHVFLKRTGTEKQLLHNVRVTWNSWVVGLGQPFECMALSEERYRTTAIERGAVRTETPPTDKSIQELDNEIELLQRQRKRKLDELKREESEAKLQRLRETPPSDWTQQWFLDYFDACIFLKKPFDLKLHCIGYTRTVEEMLQVHPRFPRSGNYSDVDMVFETDGGQFQVDFMRVAQADLSKWLGEKYKFYIGNHTEASLPTCRRGKLKNVVTNLAYEDTRRERDRSEFADYDLEEPPKPEPYIERYRKCTETAQEQIQLMSMYFREQIEDATKRYFEDRKEFDFKLTVIEDDLAKVERRMRERNMSDVKNKARQLLLEDPYEFRSMM